MGFESSVSVLLLPEALLPLLGHFLQRLFVLLEALDEHLCLLVAPMQIAEGPLDRVQLLQGRVPLLKSFLNFVAFPRLQRVFVWAEELRGRRRELRGRRREIRTTVDIDNKINLNSRCSVRNAHNQVVSCNLE